MFTDSTPGPWEAEALTEHGHFASDRPTVGYVGDYRIVAEGRGYDSHGEDMDDALMAAAAPEMFRVLGDLRTHIENAHDEFHSMDGGDLRKWMALIDAALSKAVRPA